MKSSFAPATTPEADFNTAACTQVVRADVVFKKMIHEDVCNQCLNVGTAAPRWSLVHVKFTGVEDKPTWLTRAREVQSASCNARCRSERATSSRTHRSISILQAAV